MDVQLQIKGTSKTQKFGKEHAENILRLKKTAWELKDEKWTFNGINLVKNGNIKSDRNIKSEQEQE